VTRQLELDLKPLIKENPQAALALADELWKDDYFEMRQVAIFILRMLPLETPDPVVSRLQKWLSPRVDRGLSRRLLSTGTRQLQDQFPRAWESLIQSLLESDEPELTALGIRGLAEGLQNPHFQNLPAVFRLVSPFIQNPQRDLQNELIHLIEVLAQDAPTETGFFLQQALSISEEPATTRLIKRCLKFFPEKEQATLTESLRK
jgi:hypothetical protein